MIRGLADSRAVNVSKKHRLTAIDNQIPSFSSHLSEYFCGLFDQPVKLVNGLIPWITYVAVTLITVFGVICFCVYAPHL